MAKIRSTNTSYKKWLGVAPLFDPAKGITVIKPPARGEGYWCGAPSALFDDDSGKFYLYYRVRKPRPVRGGEVFIKESRDGKRFRTIWHATREDFDSPSIERSALVKCPDGRFRLYISYVDGKDARWRIDMMEAATPAEFDPAKRCKILTADDTDTEAVKDPAVYLIGGLYYMIVSIATRPKRVSRTLKKKMHATADVHTTGITKSETGLAVSADGINFEWKGKIFATSEKGWDSYCSRINSILYLPPVFTAFYDGIPDVSQNYEEKTGIAVTTDLCNFHRLTKDEPALKSPYGGALRYIDVFVLENKIYYYYECATKDGSHELRLNIVPLE